MTKRDVVTLLIVLGWVTFGLVLMFTDYCGTAPPRPDPFGVRR